MIHRSHLLPKVSYDRRCRRCRGSLVDGMVAVAVCPAAEPNADGRTWRTKGDPDPTSPRVALPDRPDVVEGPGD